MNVCEQYEKIAQWFDKNRSRELFEKPYLDLAISHLKAGAKVLDLGCGMGDPIAKYFLDQGFVITGVDGCRSLIELAKSRLPNATFIVQDMRTISFRDKFDCVIAWHSFFHLQASDQKKMFQIFKNHIKPGGVLVFTSGPKAGEIWSDNGGENLYHASLAQAEYKELLEKHNFKVITHTTNDKKCGGATVWIAKHEKHTTPDMGSLIKIIKEKTLVIPPAVEALNIKSKASQK